MVKKLQLIMLFVLCLSVGLFAQTVILSDQFDNGDGKWNAGWIEGSTDVTFSIDTNSVLSGKNSYLADITTASATTYFIQRVADCPLLAGNQYTLSFMAVADKEGASINVLFELEGDPYTKRLNVIEPIATTPTVYTYKVIATEDVPTNQVKLHYGGSQNDGTKIWVDSIVVVQEPDPTLVNNWGLTNRGKGWPILNDTSTVNGAASIGDEAGPVAGQWHTMRGEFNETLQATLDQAVVVSGQLQYVGGDCGAAYGPIRYALTYQDSTTLNYQYTDSAMWTGKNHWGYEFTPRSSTGNTANGGGGVGTVWTINNGGGWNSTWSNNGRPIIDVQQAPRNAEITEGTYNWAISVQQVSDTTNEIRWYLVKTDNKYWFGGTVVDTAVTTKFNGICLSIGDDLQESGITEFKVSGVQASLGTPITVPEAPFEGWYINEWGLTNRGSGWPILNDTTTWDGDASIGDEAGPVQGQWHSMRGAFGVDLEISMDKAIIVSGELEYVGGDCGAAYGPIRYALTYQDSAVLNYQYTDSAMWTGKNHWGYEFTPRSSTGITANGGGGVGTVWTINNGGGWNSTWGNNGRPIINVQQAPRNAEITEGVYEWAISVQQVSATENEIRWYLQKKAAAGVQTSYWYGGTVVDTAVTTKFNGVCFSIGDDLHESGITEFKIIEAFVDLGDPITIPEKPWEDYNIDQWGFIGGNTGGWTNEEGLYYGDFSMSGAAAPSGWAALRGGFETVELQAGDVYEITGEIELVGGGFQDMASLRLGIFYSDSAGTTQQDSALDSSWVWTGVGTGHYGYLFLPHSGTNSSETWSVTGEEGTFGAIVNGNWMDTDNGTGYVLGNKKQVPEGAVGGASTYDFHMAVGLNEDGTANVVMQLMDGEDYIYEVSVVDDNDPLATTKFNSVCFGINNATTTALNLINVMITKPDEFPPLDVEQSGSDLIPTKFSLEQNYPNPFNPATTIKFGLPQQSDVKLVVYDILGQVIAEIANKKMNAGMHEITFNAGRFASGVYFYRIEAGDFVKVKKMMLLK